LELCDFIASFDNGPLAVNTALGWCISGPIEQNHWDADLIVSNRIAAREHRLQVSEACRIEMMQNIYEMELSEPSSKSLCSKWPPFSSAQNLDPLVSQEGRHFLSLMESECKLIDGHYQLLLLFDTKTHPCQTTEVKQFAEP
jgi:hypothetical protein